MNNEKLREKLRIIIFQSDTPLGKAFDVALLWCILASILVVILESMSGMPLLPKKVLTVLEYIFTFFFTLEYLCRLYCAEKPRQYALSFFGIIDLLSTLPLYIGWFFGPMRYLMVVRTFRLIRVFRVFKLFSFLQEGDLLMRSLLISAPKIGVFFLFMVIMVISTGTLMYMVEGSIPGTPFKDIPTSIYWATVTMTTVGYGDIAPATLLGRVLSAVLMLMGYTIMAVPTGIVSAQMVHDHKSHRKGRFCPECGSPLPPDAHFCPFCGLKQETELPTGKSILPLIALFLLTGSATASAQDGLLSGTVIGTKLSVDYSSGQASTTVNTAANAFDGDLSTCFASYERSRTWVGLDLGERHVITRVGWSPRNDGYGPNRMLLALFEGANSPDFLDAVPLYMIDRPGIIGEMSHADVHVSRGFRYVRYVGPADARCNVAELAFYGHAGEGDDSRFYQLTNLPTLSFHTQDNIEPYDKVNEIPSAFTIVYQDGTMIQEERGTSRLRGNASMAHPKKPYRIKLAESRHMFKGSDMRSPAKAKKWTLINNYDDKTLMRNLVAFEIARRMGMSYVPWSKPVDVIVNGEYRGCYQLTDQLTIDKNRINITEMEPTDTEGEALTGGYLLELDGYANQEASWFTSLAGNPVTIKSPDEDDITTEQAQYIRREFNMMEQAILAPDFADPVLGFRSRLDETSLLQYFLSEELIGNPDAFWSCYITKDRGDDLFRLGPVWDFDNAFDNDYRNFPTNDLGDYLSLARGGAGNSRALLKRLFSDPALRDSMAVMWNTVRRQGNVTAGSLTAYIDSTAAELMQSQRLNFMRWPILDQKIQVNPRAGGSYEVEVGWMKEYVEKRIPWLDNMVNAIPEEGEEPEVMEIASAADLLKFASRVNSGNTSLCAVLKADINFTSYRYTMIGNDKAYSGTFDGAGHTITIAQNRSDDYAGLFGHLSGTVRDLTVRGTITTDKKFAGLVGNLAGGTLLRCQSYINIRATINGDGTHGGLAGLISDGPDIPTIQDCIFAGSINGAGVNCCGGLVGWASSIGFISNSLMAGTMNISPSGGDVICRNNTNAILRDTYFLSGWDAETPSEAISTDSHDMVSGRLCYLLNAGRTDESQAWYQTLDEDPYPVPDNTHLPVWCHENAYTNEDPDGIPDLMKSDKSLNGKYYDLSGRRVSGVPSGSLYIINNKKYVKLH